jgi:ribosomal protein L37AE/L43A
MECRRCKLPIHEKRAALGYVTCRVCSEVVGSHVTRTVAPMHKSNYMLVSNRADLAGINSKGGYHA